MTDVVDPGVTGSRQAIVRAGLQSLDRAAVPHALRNGRLTVDDPAADLDVLIRPADLPRLHAALTGDGWLLLRAPGHRGHHFYLREAADLTWVKLDVVTRLRYGREREATEGMLARRRRVDDLWLVSEPDARRHDDHRAAGRREIASWAEKLGRALPVSWRRRGCVVAVLGPDGAGKGTVTAGVAASLPVGVTRVYLGDRRAQTASASSPCRSRTPVGSTAPGVDTAGSTLRSAREIVFLLRKLVGWTPSLLRAYVAAWRGHVVLTDRHPLDAVAVRPRRTPAAEAFERFLALRLVPPPDAIVVLDAPGQVLFERKREHTPELLEQWRTGYRDRLGPRGADLIDAAGDLEDTIGRVRHVIWRALSRRRGWPQP